VLNEACRAALAFGAASPTTMAVNISARQLGDDGFVDVVLAALRDSGLAPERLVLEITETAVMADLPNVAPRLQELRQLGVRVAIDDFGTGYSSLSYLTNLPVDILKVDKSFIDDVAHSGHAASVADAIISMSQSLNLATVAEGVERASQAQWLRGAHCTLGQGYLWSRPVPLPEALLMLNRPVVHQH
jgi:EAL domain-containing protein (putative c-di-GMP-specific phosphodiesterase class I)